MKMCSLQSNILIITILSAMTITRSISGFRIARGFYYCLLYVDMFGNVSIYSCHLDDVSNLSDTRCCISSGSHIVVSSRLNTVRRACSIQRIATRSVEIIGAFAFMEPFGCELQVNIGRNVKLVRYVCVGTLFGVSSELSVHTGAVLISAI